MSSEQNTEELPTGIRSVEQSQGFEKMPMATPDPPRDDYHDLAGEEIDAHGAAEELANRRANTAHQPDEPLERRYNRAGGSHAGEKMPDNNVIELDRASKDLTGAREAEQAAEAEATSLELQQAIDRLRAGEPKSQAEQQQPYQEQPQAEQPQEQAQPARSKAWEDPEVIAGVSEYARQTEAAVQGLQQQYIQSLAGNAQTALAAAVTQFGELRSVTDINQIPVVINAVAQSNPQRAQAMAEAVKGTLQTLQDWQNASVQYQQQQAAQYQQQWNTFAQEQDSKFEQKYPDLPYEVQKGAREYLHNIGFSDDDLNKSWNGQYSWSPRDARVQEIIRDASLYRQAQQAARGKVARPVPTVQRPGSPAARGSEEDYNLSKYSAELDRTGSAKAAAALLQARRANRR